MKYDLQISQLLIEKAPVIILILGADQKVQFLNDRGCRLIGLSKEAVIGKNWFDEFLPPESQAQVKSLFNQIIEEKATNVANYENPVKTHDGDVVFISWNSELLRNDSGKVHAVVAIGEDVTDKKILLKKLLTQESLKRSQLNRAIEKAKETERDEIASELHDNINQSLTTCKLLLEQELQGGSKLPFASKAFNILQDTINEIRNLSHRISSGTLTFADLQASLKSSLEEIKLATGMCTKLTITGHDVLSNAPITILANIFRIIQEQLNNIVKHAEARSVAISLQAEQHAINMEIKDDGKGFDLSSVKKGLGLNSIFKRAEINQGKVYVDTAPGQGCLISVFIPFG